MNDGKTSLKSIFAVLHARLYIFMCANTILNKLRTVIFFKRDHESPTILKRQLNK